MMKNKSILPFLFFLISISVLAYRIDDDPFSALLKKMEIYNEKYPQEKVHLHLDKPYYAIGDDIWFKAYVINAQTAKLSTISSSLYVELINEKDSIKKQIKLPLVSGVSWGDFKLPDSLTEGNYRIRAYTQWMRNAGTDFFFDKTIKTGNSWANKVFVKTQYTYAKQQASDQVSAVIKFTDDTGKPYAQHEVSYEVLLSFRSIAKAKAITNEQGEINISFLNTQPSLYKSGKIVATLSLPDKKKVIKNIPVKATSNAVDVQFFPEGGNLVENLPTKIGIKAINASGLGEDIEGVILDDLGQEMNKFSTRHLGMGHFTLNAQAGKTYSAKIKYKDGSENTVSLPKAMSSGYALSVSSNTENVVSKIMLTTDLVGSGELKLVAQNNGNIYFVSKAEAKKQIITTSIPRKDLPSGIIQFTLFSAGNLPVCERLVFVNNTSDKIDLNITSPKTAYGKREKVDLDLTAMMGGKPLQGSFSVAVTNTAAVRADEENESNIFTSLLLTADIMGYIEKPNYYFLKNDAETQRDLDDLMLTQGWRRVLWKNIINGLPPNIRFEPEKSLKISGTVTTYGGKPVPKSKVMLFSSSGGVFATDTVTDDKGRFSFDHLIFNDSTRFVVQARNAKNGKHVDINLDVTAGQVVTKNKNSGDIEINVNEALSSYLKQSGNFFDEMTRRGILEKSITLKEINIVEKKNPAKNSSNLNGAGNADAIITAEQLKTCTSLSQCLQGRVAGLIVRSGIPYLIRNGNTPMQIVVDGMPVESTFLDNINPFDVETIEVLKSIGNTAIYGSSGTGGVLVITTKTGGGALSRFSGFTPGIVTFAPKGFYVPREFYSPKYEVTSSLPDLRTTIYWNPHVTSNSDGKGSFSFYNADQAGTYRVVAEGIDLDGNLGRTVYTYEVK